MKFEEILPHLKKGEKAFRRKDVNTAQEHYVYLENDEIMRQYIKAFNQGTQPCESFIDYDDLVAEDWELYHKISD